MIRILKEASGEGLNFMEELKKRADMEQKDVTRVVEEILHNIREKGDEALIGYTRKFDCPVMEKENLKVTEAEIKAAYGLADKEFIEALKEAKDNIADFHEKQKRNTWMTNKDKGIILGQTIRGLDKVGLYVPGGTAAYPSSVLMNAVPAKVAGVNQIVMVTPPGKDGSINPNILVAADIAGVDEIYKIGGAQAVGALSFGTETVPKVDKIVGPGNIYVAMAKRSVYGYVDIDMIAGPSEILVISDESGDPKFLAADIMSQCEHDVLASSVLLTTSLELAEKVKAEIERQIQYLSRRTIIEESLKNYCAIIVVEDIKEAVELANNIAPEHLELMVKDPFLMLGEIKNAGSVFLGDYSPEPLGDYFAGPNHVLPTSGTARFFSPLSVDDFIKKSSFIYYSREALEPVNKKIIKMAEVEGLTAHANSIRVRFE
jgi:histidinol dehydrogenase